MSIRAEKFLSDFKQSVLFQSLRVPYGVIKGPIAYYQAILTNTGEMAPWLHKSEAQEQQDVEAVLSKEQERKQFFLDLRERLHEGDTIAGEKFEKKWKKIRCFIKAAVEHFNGQGQKITVSDYCAIDNGGNHWFLAHTLGLGEVFYLVNMCDGVIESITPLESRPSSNTSLSLETFLLDHVSKESVYQLREIIPICGTTNSIEVIHHKEWEREGAVIMRMVMRGSDSHDEIESVVQATLRRGLSLSQDGKCIEFAEEKMRNLLYDLHDLSVGNEKSKGNGSTSEKTKENVDEVLRSHLYFRYALQWIALNPSIVRGYVRNASFPAAEQALLDHSMASYGQSHYQNAKMILANAMLYRFEGYQHREDSPTQFQWANSWREFHEAVEYLEQENAPIHFSYDRTTHPEKAKHMQYDALVNMRDTFRDLKHPLATIQNGMAKSWKSALDVNATVMNKKLDDCRAEINRRQKYHPVFLQLLAKLGFHVDEKYRHSILTTLLGNLMMAKVLHPSRVKFVAHATTPDSLGFITDLSDKALAKRLSALDLSVKKEDDQLSQDIKELVMYCLTGNEFDDEGKFEAAALRIVKVAPRIMDFLANDDLVPEEIRKLSQTISDPHALMTEALKKIDPAWADNPHYVNIFAHGGTNKFQATVYLTWVRDFVTAVETELKLQEGVIPNVERRLSGWKPLKNQPDESKISTMIPIVLDNARRRIYFVDHSKTEEPYRGGLVQKVLAQLLMWPGRQPESLRDFIDIFETIVAPFIPSAEYRRKFLYWDKYTDLLAESWRCYCQTREQHSFFNVKTAVAM